MPPCDREFRDRIGRGGDRDGLTSRGRRGPRRAESSGPSKTHFGPAGQVDPSSRHSTRCVPPGATTSTSRAAPPCAIAAIADAQAPVPDACVGPTPRSQIRMRTRPGASITANSTLVPAGKRGCVASAGPRRWKRARVRQCLDQRHALRIADPQGGDRQRLASDLEGLLVMPLGLPHRRAKRVAAAVRGRSASASSTRHRCRRAPRSRRASAPARADAAPARPGSAGRCPTAPTGCRRR